VKVVGESRISKGISCIPGRVFFGAGKDVIAAKALDAGWNKNFNVER
jgi:hypothetical protein